MASTFQRWLRPGAWAVSRTGWIMASLLLIEAIMLKLAFLSEKPEYMDISIGFYELCAIST
jgi:hypothetical protein